MLNVSTSCTLNSCGPVAQSGQSSGLIIRWLQVQVLPGPLHTDQGKHPKTPVVATDSG